MFGWRRGRHGRKKEGRNESNAPGVATASWVALARRFMRGEGGTLHITEPAAELLERYGYELHTAIYAHFKRAGADTEARSYLRVGESSSEERIATQYVPEQDALVIWRWGEAEHDPDLALIEELDVEA